MEKASELTATVTSNLPQHFSFRDSLKLALEKTGLFNRELPPEATKQQRWEARFEGPLLIVSIVFLAFFAWYTLAEPGGWAETISGCFRSRLRSAARPFRTALALVLTPHSRTHPCSSSVV